MIEQAKQNVINNINSELIRLYWNIGEYLSVESRKASWGEGYIDSIANDIKEKCPDMKGFNRRGLYRMMQFYEAYKDNEFVSPLVTQLSWTNHLLILSGAKTIEEKEFYIGLCIKEKYSKRELDRQINSAYFHRYMLSEHSDSKTSGLKNKNVNLLDYYALDFLDLPEKHSENDLQKAIIKNLKSFILEIGKDFSFVGENYRVQVGKSDFFIDLLFFHRELQCLVAFELKIDKFQPEYLGKMDFYLEALDREHKKANENLSIGVILCTDKDDDVVEFAMSRSLSPLMIAEYKMKLIDKKLLENKLKEFRNMLMEIEEL